MKARTLTLVALSMSLAAFALAQPPKVQVIPRFKPFSVGPLTNLGTAVPQNAVRKGRIDLSREKLGLVRRTPVTKFQALEFKENGRPVEPNRRITTADRQSITVQEAQDGQNELERTLNKDGYSLYTDDEETKPLFQVRPTLNASRLRQQSTNLKNLRDTKLATLTPKVKGIRESASQLEARLQTLIDNQRKLAAAIWEQDRYKGPETFQREKSVALELGSNEWFAVGLQAGVAVKGAGDERVARASADLNATILGNNASLVHGLVEAKDTRRLFTGRPRIRIPGSRYKLHAEVSVLGVDLIAPIDQAGDTLSLTQTYSKAIDFRYDIEIPIIPGISAVGTIGAHGEGGLKVGISADASSGLSFGVSPFITSTVFAEASVAVGFPIAKIEGGVGANLTLVNYQIDFTAAMQPTIESHKGIAHHAIRTPLQVSHSLTALQGNVHAFVRLGYWSPTFTDPFRIKRKTLWDADLFSWEGFKESGVIASFGDDPVLLPIPVLPAGQ
ncbi:hypothetical protein [Armatimonas sp.]|uniref:hypothetical protein n=1 Tax=Armatimonas sp. TaxID=1872638 RepID=UPI00286A5C7F|nr:hypothetical protein [Armatimonas sp.]